MWNKNYNMKQRGCSVLQNPHQNCPYWSEQADFDRTVAVHLSFSELPILTASLQYPPLTLRLKPQPLQGAPFQAGHLWLCSVLCQVPLMKQEEPWDKGFSIAPCGIIQSVLGLDTKTSQQNSNITVVYCDEYSLVSAEVLSVWFSLTRTKPVETVPKLKSVLRFHHRPPSEVNFFTFPAGRQLGRL